jgi:tetratricopeptide (TPR) repeat protein
MHEIFISYSSKHRECARELADAIEAHYGEGSAWWEHELEARASREERIAAALEVARVVIVLWTEGAPVSDWVCAEAMAAHRRNKLVNVRPEDVSLADIPEPFNGHHICELSDRDGILAAMAKVWGEPLPTRKPLDQNELRLEPGQDKLAADARRVLPSELLQARYAVTPYIDATGAKADCAAWCLSGEPAAGRLIHGPGGLGKTRLMIETAAQLRDQGWTAGFLDRAHKRQALEERVLHGDDSGLLLVVDDAEGRRQEVIELAALLATAPGARPLRLVLLARSGDWWERLREERPEVQRLFRRDAAQVDTQALLPIADAGQRRALFQDAVRAFWPILAKQGFRKPSQPPTGARLKAISDSQAFERPLAIQMEALLWLCSASPAETCLPAQLDAVLDLECRHWEKLCGALNGDAQRDMGRGAAQVTLVGGTQTLEASESLLMEDDFYTSGRTARSDLAAPLSNLAEVYGRGDGLTAIQPSLLGDHFAAMTADDETIQGALRWIEGQPEEERETRRRDLIAMLQRATLPEHGPAVTAKAVERLDWLIQKRMAELAPGIAAIMADTPGQLLERVQCAVDTLDLNALRPLDFALPWAHPKLLVLALAVSTRHAGLAKAALCDAEADEQDAEALAPVRSMAAAALNQAGMRLSALGNQEEALAAWREAADIYRRLTETRPDEFLPHLAGSLKNLLNRLSNLGRREEALAVASETAEVYRRLAEARPDAFLPDLAMHLNNLGNRRAELGRREEALPAVSEAVGIYRRLAEARPDVFLPGLARSLNNLGIWYSDLGRHDEGLAASREAVALQRTLVDTRQESSMIDLAKCLGAQSQVLGAMERNDEAAGAAAESLTILAPFVETFPQAFAPLAQTLGRLYMNAAEAGEAPQDNALLERVGKAIMRAMKDEERAEAQALLAVAKNEAARAEKAESMKADAAVALEEDALALLPPHLADQLRAARSPRKQTEPADG